MTGLVSLVGAGPGDPELLTLKALKRLQEADLIIYDYLANPEHLRHARIDSVKISVGKNFRHKKISQARINRLIVDSARRGKRVVRLKGGDPYLFGRGGEEALYLADKKILFEVVPGVTSATACAAYAGIPLTHRDHNAAVTFLTGHRADDKMPDSIPWEKIAHVGGTIVIYMGLYNLQKTSVRLIHGGLSRHTPVAVIEWGTLPRQRSISGTLADIALKSKKARLSAPCMIIIGEVVSLKDRLGWFERLPLFGKKVVVTRSAEKCGAFGEKLAALGAQVIEFPLIQIESPGDLRRLDQAIGDASAYDWLIFSSAHGVRAFFERVIQLKLDVRALSGAKIASVGDETTRALARYGVLADLVPGRFETRAILDALKNKHGTLKGKKFLLLKANIAPVDLDLKLKKMGALVHRLIAYRTVMPKTVPTDTKKLIARGGVDFVAFTSASTVQNFVRVMGRSSVARIARKTKFLSIGPITTKTLKSYGLRPYVEAKVFTTSGLIEALKKRK